MRKREFEIFADDLFDVGTSDLIGVGDFDDFEDLKVLLVIVAKLFGSFRESVLRCRCTQDGVA